MDEFSIDAKLVEASSQRLEPNRSVSKQLFGSVEKR